MSPVRSARSSHGPIHLERAEEYLASANDSLSAERLEAAASDAVVAAIRASDAICAIRLRQRWTGADHRGAITLLLRVEPEGPAAAPLLEKALPYKNQAQYGIQETTADEAEHVVRLATELVELARAVVDRQQA